MSRIGRAPIAIPAGVTVTVGEGNEITVKGPKGTLTQTVSPKMTIEVDGAVDLDGHLGGNGLGEGALGALHGDLIAFAHRDGDASGDGDGRSADSRHACYLLTIRTQGLRRRHGACGLPCRS